MGIVLMLCDKLLIRTTDIIHVGIELRISDDLQTEVIVAQIYLDKYNSA
jgi:hypothetical protein